MPEIHTIAHPFPINKLSDQLRFEIANAGWTEVLNFALCSREDISVKLRKGEELEDAIQISNPKTLEFQAIKTIR